MCTTGMIIICTLFILSDYINEITNFIIELITIYSPVVWSKFKVMFGNSFCFLFSKICFWNYKEKTIFLYFLNQKHVWLVEIKKIIF